MAQENIAEKPMASHGRGGAGNINKRPENTGVNPTDLSTPTIKGATYTTGRGGTGNMATNLEGFPEMARAAQDVEAPAAHHKETKGTFHWGRGGQGNAATVGYANAKEEGRERERLKDAERAKSKERKDEKKAEKAERAKSKERPAATRGTSMLEKGKEMLGLGGAKKTKVEDEFAASSNGSSTGAAVRKSGEVTAGAV